jgi:hypothetical protein
VPLNPLIVTHAVKLSFATFVPGRKFTPREIKYMYAGVNYTSVDISVKRRRQHVKVIVIEAGVNTNPGYFPRKIDFMLNIFIIHYFSPFSL